MKSTILKVAVTAAIVTGASPAFANLIYADGVQVTGTGLGAVQTVVTVQDNNLKGGTDNGTESGCVTYSGNINNPTYACGMGLQGNDNTAGSAGNNTYLLSSIAGLADAGQLGLVVNVSEGAPANDATLTDLYLSLYNITLGTTKYFAYTGPDLILKDTDGVGVSGKHTFILNDAEALAAKAFCPVLSDCVVAGGIQFAFGTTEATPETMYIGAFEGGGDTGGGEAPEPASIALFGAGLLALRGMRRKAKK
jgi:hypothetical protein